MITRSRLIVALLAIVFLSATAWLLFPFISKPVQDEGIINWPDSPSIVFKTMPVTGEVPVLRSDYRSITINGRLFLASVTFSEYPENLRKQCSDDELLTAVYAGVIPSVTIHSDIRRLYGKYRWPCREIVFQDSKGRWTRGVAVIIGANLCDISVGGPDPTIIMGAWANHFLESLEIK